MQSKKAWRQLAAKAGNRRKPAAHQADLGLKAWLSAGG
jgi:hypothetical protein